MQRRYIAGSKQPPRGHQKDHRNLILSCLRCWGSFPSLTCSSSIVDPCKWCSTSEMRLVTNSLSLTRSFSDSASSLRITSNSSFSFFSSFTSSLSRICLSLVKFSWTLCISFCIWAFRNEKKTERGTWAIGLRLGVRKITILLGKFPQGVKVSQSCLTLCNPMDYTVHGIL